jgi:hypothetical protein
LDLDNPAGRPASRPAAGGGAAGDFLQNQPSAGNRQDRTDNRGDRQGTRDDRQSDRQGNQGDRQGTRDDRQSDRQVNQGDRQDNRANRVEDRQAYQQNRVDRRNEVRNQYHNHPSHLPHYGRNFWAGNNWRWGWNNHRANWWAWASAGAITGWVTGGYGEPAYYNYGDNCYYEDDTVYYEGEPVATADEFATQAQTIAMSVPEVEPASVEWLPLGVYALTQGGEASGPEPTIFLQLAISKEGIIAGTIQNTATDNSTEVEGMIDKKSQRAAWGAVGKDWPIMETGIYNLSQDDAPALLHFADGQTQQWLMVRLEEPEGDGTSP